jgi:hypothetical protein
MALPDNLDHDKLAEAALAILSLTAREEELGVRAWKGMDWELTDLLYEKGWICDPKGKAKSVIFTEEGTLLADTFMEKYFCK